MLLVTTFGLAFLGIYRPRDYLKKYRSGEFKPWQLRAPAVGLPIAAAVLVGVIAIAIRGSAPRFALGGLAVVLLISAVLIGVREPSQLQPAWVRHAETADAGKPRGERAVLIVAAMDLSSMGIIALVAEGVTTTTVGSLLLGLGAFASGLSRRRRTARS